MWKPDDKLTSLIAAQIALLPADVCAACRGVTWLTSLVEANPEITIAEGVEAARAANVQHDWAFELLFRQWADLYPDLRVAMIEMIPVASAKYIAIHMPLEDHDKAILRVKLAKKLAVRPEFAAQMEGKL